MNKAIIIVAHLRESEDTGLLEDDFRRVVRNKIGWNRRQRSDNDLKPRHKDLLLLFWFSNSLNDF